MIAQIERQIKLDDLKDNGIYDENEVILSREGNKMITLYKESPLARKMRVTTYHVSHDGTLVEGIAEVDSEVVNFDGTRENGGDRWNYFSFLYDAGMLEGRDEN